MRSRHRLVVVVAALSLAAPAVAADPPQNGAGGAAPDTETSVASSRSRRIRETPGVVTILPRDELLASGARDLAEVLARVPGFELGVDVTSAVGAGFRGVWGHEGKILYLLDGVELNDLSYGTFPILRHINVEQLERIEIIRGPGSALYGGHAELAVVNVVTRAGVLDGASVAMVGGRTATTTSGSSVTATAGATAGGLRFGATASVGGGEASDRTYTDVYGTQADLAGASGIRPVLVTARAVWRWLDVRAVYDDYKLQTIDAYDAVLSSPADVRWRTAAIDARGTIDLGSDVKLLPRFTYRWEQPWQETNANLVDLYYDVTNQQAKGRLALEWDTFVGPSVVAGVEGAVEQGRIDHPSVVDSAGDPLLSYAGKPSVTYSWMAAFAEVENDSRWVNLLAGARLETHSTFGTSFVPRIAATRVFGQLHAKLLASGAYRTPSIENVNYAVDGKIAPERTTVYEAEIGWQPTEALSIVANVFDLTVKNPIVYSFAGLDAYANEDRTGSRGVESELQLRLGRSTASLSYAYYTASGKNRVPEYAVAGDPKLLAGFAGHKVIATAHVRPTRHFVVSPSVAWFSERAMFDGTEAPGEPAAGRIGPRTYVDLFASWQDVGARGVEVGFGVRDLFDQGTLYVQPYPGGHAPLPGNGREVWLRVRYERGLHE